jgi:predicted RNase H-like HicB family nuclease
MTVPVVAANGRPEERAMVTIADDFSMTVVIKQAEGGSGYIAYIRELPECFADGETEQEAADNLRDVTSAYFETQYARKH